MQMEYGKSQKAKNEKKKGKENPIKEKQMKDSTKRLNEEIKLSKWKPKEKKKLFFVYLSLLNFFLLALQKFLLFFSFLFSSFFRPHPPTPRVKLPTSNRFPPYQGASRRHKGKYVVKQNDTNNLTMTK